MKDKRIGCPYIGLQNLATRQRRNSITAGGYKIV
jgi:hypothetical protein